jgi:hypothetical protein
MRLWRIPLQCLCKNHLLGLHREIHMINGSMMQIKNNQQNAAICRANLQGLLKATHIWLTDLPKYHDEVVSEMNNRGYRHMTPFPFEVDWKVLVSEVGLIEPDLDQDETHYATVNDIGDLWARCKVCAGNIEKVMG